MRRKVITGLVGTVAALLCIGCGQIPTGTSRNAALCSSQVACDLKSSDRHHDGADLARARSTFKATDKFQPSVFVGLALSGGGSRAANFALAAMEQLEQLGMLRHVTAVSSTSGGGLPAAYYALNGAQMHGLQGDALWLDAKEKMRHDFRDEWLFNWLLPWNLAKTSLTHTDRSDLMAEIFDRHLFDRATFARLAEVPAERRPLWIANATRVSGGLFPFTEESFRELGSNLRTYPISQAVMASAAFPGAFNSVTLNRYPRAPTFVAAARGPLPEGYVHLMDGGPADNLGVESLLRLVASRSYRTPVPDQDFKPLQRPAMQRTPPVPCLLIVVDAFPEGVSARDDYDPDPRGLKDHFVDFNFMSAFDAFLARRRSDFLTLSGLRTRDQPLGSLVPLWIRPDGFASYSTAPAHRFSTIEFPLPAHFAPGGSPSNAYGVALDILPQVRPASPLKPDGEAQGRHDSDTAVCSIWHIALDNIASMPVVRKGEDGVWASAPVQPSAIKDDDAFYYRTKLRWLTSQIDTDFKLAGPPACSSRFLQDTLFVAARVAMREDGIYLAAACRWFKRHGLAVSTDCEDPLPPLGETDLPLPIMVDAPRMGRSGRPIHQAVRCIGADADTASKSTP